MSRLVPLALLCATACAHSAPPPALARPTPTAVVRADATRGEARITAFFGAPFPHPVAITVAPDRAAFDAALHDLWGFPATQCWMVGAGGADALVVLSPAAWETEACEHDPSDPTELQELVTHELVHSYHAQRNPTDDLDGMDPLGWLVEGLASYVSGQLADRHAGEARRAIEAGAVPNRLANAWSGHYRYAIAGSMVAFIDARWGRDTLTRLLGVTTQAQALDLLDETEPGFLADWTAWVKDRP